MVQPRFLKKGDTIGILSTARKISAEEVRPAVELIESRGFSVVLGETIGAEEHQFAGNDNLRLSDFQQMLDDDNISAILCARGGYGTVRIIDGIDWKKFTSQPKWICGYSDVTVLHSHIEKNFAIPTLHCSMPLHVFRKNQDEKSVQGILDGLTGEVDFHTAPAHQLNREGTATAKLVGGNLSILSSLLGSASDINTEGKILFIEEVDEYLYHIDRMMMALKRAKKLHKLAGLVVGGMTKMNDNIIPYGKTAEEIILEHVQEYGFPVAFGFPAGHGEVNLPLYLGVEVSFNVIPEGVDIAFSQIISQQ